MRDALTVLIAICCLGVFSYSQTADDLVAKNIQATGGITRIKAIKNIRMTGKFEGGGGFKASVGQQNERPNLIRETFSLQGMTAVQAYDGTTGWQIQPFGGKKDPELMGEDDLRDLLLDADFDEPLVDYKDKGNTVEYLGHDLVDGTTYRPVFDREDTQSIGAVAIDPSNSKNVWVGTGEGWVRNSVSVGDGVYKSIDGSENWTNVGLKDSEHVAKILVNPGDSNDVLVCAMGHLWDDNDERGVYQTTDGGKTWKKVLAGTNGSSGCAMLARSKHEPKTIYAAMWDFRRQGWTFRSGGPGSGLFKSTDSGAHWIAVNESNAKGLPAKPWGRVAVQVAPSKPQVVYVNVEAEKGRGLYRFGRQRCDMDQARCQ